MVVAYRVGPVTHLILKRLLTTKFATLFNIAAGEAIAPEFLQDTCTADNLIAALTERLDDPAMAADQVERQTAALTTMGAGGRDPSTVAAEAVVDMLMDRRGAAAP